MSMMEVVAAIGVLVAILAGMLGLVLLAEDERSDVGPWLLIMFVAMSACYASGAACGYHSGAGADTHGLAVKALEGYL